MMSAISVAVQYHFPAQVEVYLAPQYVQLHVKFWNELSFFFLKKDNCINKVSFSLAVFTLDIRLHEDCAIFVHFMNGFYNVRFE